MQPRLTPNVRGSEDDGDDPDDNDDDVAMIHTASNSMRPWLTPNVLGTEDDRDDFDDADNDVNDGDDDENAMNRPALSPIATCYMIWKQLISPKWTPASRHHPKLKEGCDGTRLM